MNPASATTVISAGLYTPEERVRRDNTIWTPVQGFLAAFQFIVFGISVCLITRYMVTGQGESLGGVVGGFQDLGALHHHGHRLHLEKVVFGKWLFAKSFSGKTCSACIVLGLHTAYLMALFTGSMTTRDQLWLALAAYTADGASMQVNSSGSSKQARIQERATLALQQELAA
jgi:3-vinyl bacteriochlorophyllide hydratase